VRIDELPYRAKELLQRNPRQVVLAGIAAVVFLAAALMIVRGLASIGGGGAGGIDDDDRRAAETNQELIRDLKRDDEEGASKPTSNEPARNRRLPTNVPADG